MSMFKNKPLRASRQVKGTDVAHVGSVIEQDGIIAIYAVDPSMFDKLVMGDADLQAEGYRDLMQARAAGWVIDGV